MAEVAAITGNTVTVLDAGWEVAMATPGTVSTPVEADQLDFVPARVPGLAMTDLSISLAECDGHDIWYRRRLQAYGAQTLVFDGLAGHAELFLDDRPILSSASMFLAHSIDFDATGDHRLSIRFKAMDSVLASVTGPRARWRPRMIVPPSLRLLRVSPFGRMPGWTPDIAMVGPWKPVSLVARGSSLRIKRLRLMPTLDGDRGRVRLAVTLNRAIDQAPVFSCAGTSLTLAPQADGGFAGEMMIDAIRPWWPHTHGDPTLYDATLRVDGIEIALPRIGFRNLALDRGSDGKGFALKVNGVAVFCRGATWTPVSPWVSEVDPAARIALARDAGMNMLRISGTMMPESPAFYRACAEAGLLVWHDLPFANFDYPVGDAGFAELMAEETRQLLDGLHASPSLAVVCGGSEIAQQATMLGLRPEQTIHPFFDEVAPALVREHAPQAVYVPHTPWGGALPFVTDEGVTHYYGVGAYRRPLADVAQARVRFATECLAFANVPSPARLRAAGLTDPAAADWKAAVPRDRGAEWDFEDVRDHYVLRLYGVDAAALRISDPQRYLAYGRAASAELMEAVFAFWRGPDSGCGGALVWLFGDFMAGAGWGVVDDRGEPKTAWYALRRALRPVAIGLVDRGLNGLGIHVSNDTAVPRSLHLVLACLGEGPHPLAQGERTIELLPHQTIALSAYEILGRFFDITEAYRFGSRAHDATVARLTDPASGVLVAEAAHVLRGQAAMPRAIGLAAETFTQADMPFIRVRAERFARFVTIDDDNFIASDQGFCLMPGESRDIALRPRSPRTGLLPCGTIAALNSWPVRYEASS